MAIGLKRASLNIIVGVIVAVLVIAAVWAGTSYIQSTAKGDLIIQITDKPTDLDHLNITIDSVEIQGQDGNWISLTLKTSPFYFDLLSLENITDTLSETAIPAGNYSMIRMHILSANATYNDESIVTLNVPSDFIRVQLKPHLTMQGGGQVTILIDLQPEVAISQSLNISPVVKSIVYQ